MRLNKNQQETLMYQSRLLFKHDNVESASDRALALTIYTNEVFDTEHFKRALYQKVHRVLYGDLSKPDNFTYSMMIAGDVEASRSGAVQCPSDITDQIGGWTTDGVGQGYGSGYPMSVLKEWLVRVE